MNYTGEPCGALSDAASNGFMNVMILNADTDAGYRLALDELAAGNRVVAIARHATGLVRILRGNSASRVFALAADFDDPGQRTRLFERVTARFGRVDRIVSAVTPGPSPSPAAARRRQPR